ncbi:MAG: hypothetical protein LBT29_02570 [Flavobacteriaceae bacterium]|jgi:predicted flap endonuclease-1-like 5' DNA nuclease|nr:hypothetical protein [Flavobacteriaceae bacterium]
MSKKSLFWIFLILGILWLIGVSYCYTAGINNFDWNKIRWNENFSSSDPLTILYFKGITFFLVSLLVLGSLCFFSGLFLGKKAEDKFKKLLSENEKLKAHISNQIETIEKIKILYTGGKIIRKENLTEFTQEEPLTEKTEEINTSLKEVPQTEDIENIVPQPVEHSDYTFQEKDDLKTIEGIGEKIEYILNENHIFTWKQLSETSADDLKNQLIAFGGAGYKIHNTDSWVNQAKLASEGNWAELEELQKKLRGEK